MNKEVIKYLKNFKSLKRGFNKGLGKAPHKPILLLSIISLIEKNLILNNRIEITSDLVLEFKSNFKKFVTTSHIDNFSLPFFHMRNEPFYRLIPRNGMMKTLNKVKSLKSINRLSELIAFAEIDKSLFDLLQQPKVRTVFINFIIEEYFPEFKNAKNQISNFYETQIETEILKENKASYISKLEIIKSEMDNDSFEQEVFIRGGIFKKTIPKIYNYSCCITGFKVNTNYNIQMIDACHIIPFSISQDDTIQNGISLSPNIHRAFDRGLITINQDYIIRVSPSINKSSSTSEITELDGKSIILPQEPRHYPSLEALEWHRKEVFLF